MREQKLLPKEFEFYIADLDNMLLVQCGEDGKVTIRCTKDNLSERRKVFFVRELAAEGFIPDEYQWFSETTTGSLRVQWLKDWSWVKVPETMTGRSVKLLLAAFVFWLAAVRVAIVSYPPDSAATAKNPHQIAYKATGEAGGQASDCNPGQHRP